MKKYIAMALTATMTIGSVVTVNAATFYDIDNVPWEGAKTYINSVSDLGLMVGDTDSSGRKVFRANDRITYCEAMQLAYSVLKNTSATEKSTDTVSKWKSVMQTANIPEWAYTAVSYGLENGVLSENDVKVFMKSQGVSRDATRENVSVIFGKAIEHLSTINSSAALSFGDKSELAPTSVPYVELLNRHNIIVGDNEGNFNPKNYINRAEMAVMTSKTYYKVKELKEAKEKEDAQKNEVTTISGTVILTDGSTTSKVIGVSSTETGAVSSFVINETTPVLTSDGGTKKYSDVSIGDTITVSMMNGIVVSVVIRTDKAVVEEEKKEKNLSGYLNNITNYAVAFDTEDGEQQRYELASSIKFYLNGGQVSRDDLYEFALGRNVVKINIKLNDNGYVNEIDAELCDIKGSVSSVTDEYIYINFDIGDLTKKIKCVPASACKFNLEGKTTSESKLQDILDGGKNLYAVAKVNSFGKATQIDFFYDTYTAGKLKSISSSDISFKTTYGKTVEYELGDDAEFTLNGAESSYKKIKNKLDDTDVIVSVEFDKDEKYIIKVEAKVLSVKGILKNVDTSRIIVVDDDDIRYALNIDSKTECEYNGDEVTYSKMKNIFADEENAMLAEVEMDEDSYTVEKFTVVSGKNDEGVAKSVSGTEITFVNSVGIKYTYKVEPAVRGYIDGTEVSLLTNVRNEALADGSTIKVTFSSRGYVNRIYVTLK